jgi:hypothetical protein
MTPPARMASRCRAYLDDLLCGYPFDHVPPAPELVDPVLELDVVQLQVLDPSFVTELDLITGHFLSSLSFLDRSSPATCTLEHAVHGIGGRPAPPVQHSGLGQTPLCHGMAQRRHAYSLEGRCGRSAERFASTIR